MLRVTEQARRIVHVPEVLYHWRVVPTSVLAGEDVKPYAYDAAAHVRSRRTPSASGSTSRSSSSSRVATSAWCGCTGSSRWSAS